MKKIRSVMKTAKYVRRGAQSIREIWGRGNYRLIFRLFLNYVWAFFKVPFGVPRPAELQIEPFLGCNLRCGMCNAKEIMKEKRNEALAERNFDFLLNQLLPLKTINFTGMGESLLNENLEEYISKADSKNVETLFITNGQLLDERRVDKIVSSGIKRISFSIESANPKIYESIRPGASLENLERNIKYLAGKIKKSGSDLAVSLNVVLLKRNIEDAGNIFGIIDFAKRCGAPLVSLQNPHDAAAHGTLIYFTKNKNALARNFQLIKEYAGKNNIEITFPNVDIQEGSCYYPWVYPQVTASGELLPCCVISQFGNYSELVEKYSFGNIFATSFEECWNSRKAKSFRSNLARNPNEFCRRCSKYLGIL